MLTNRYNHQIESLLVMFPVASDEDEEESDAQPRRCPAACGGEIYLPSARLTALT